MKSFKMYKGRYRYRKMIQSLDSDRAGRFIFIVGGKTIRNRARYLNKKGLRKILSKDKGRFGL